MFSKNVQYLISIRQYNVYFTKIIFRNSYPEAASSTTMVADGGSTNMSDECLRSQNVSRAAIRVDTAPVAAATHALPPLADTNTRAHIVCQTDSVHVEYVPDLKS